MRRENLGRGKARLDDTQEGSVSITVEGDRDVEFERFAFRGRSGSEAAGVDEAMWWFDHFERAVFLVCVVGRWAPAHDEGPADP